MSDLNKPSRVVVIADPGALQQQITSAINSQDEFLLVDVLSTPERLAREIGAAQPDIVLMDHRLNEQPTMDMVDDLAMQFPEVALIAMLPDNDPVQIQQVMLAGARAFLIQPFTQINLLSTMRRVRDLEGRRLQSLAVKTASVSENSRPLKSITVFSPRGGVGCSTIATNLALALYEASGQRVLLLEGKLFFGHLDVILNLRTHNTIADLIPHINALDEGLISDVVVRHGSGIHVLLGPNNIQIAQGIRPDDLYKVFIGLQRYYDYVIIDGGSSLTENVVTLMDSADKILLVTTPDLAALHDTSRFVQVSKTLAYPDDKLMIVLNRAGLVGGVKTKDIETALHHQVYAHVPDDPANALRSLNRGIPMLVRYPRSHASKAIKQIADKLTVMQTAEQVRLEVPGSDRVQHEMLLASSRLG
ncbi:MAG: AAA family ATPase [Anaerolineales bacterium]